MEKVYVVTSGSYSDYSIEGIFSEERLAQEYIKMFRKDSGYFGYNEIEVYNLNPYEREFRDGLKPFFLRMRKDGSAYDIDDSGFLTQNEWGFDTKDKDLYVSIFAKDQEHAIKICNERRVQLIESDKWPNK